MKSKNSEYIFDGLSNLVVVKCFHYDFAKRIMSTSSAKSSGLV